MKKLLIALGLVLLASLVLTAPGKTQSGQQFVSPVTLGGSFPYNGGALTQGVRANGGTVTCTGGGTPTITNSNLTANSVVMWGLKTAGGTPVIPVMTTVTAGTGFTITCGGSDTSVWNYLILG